MAVTGLGGDDREAPWRARRAATVEDGAAASKAVGEAMRFAPLPEAVRDELAERYDALARETGAPEPAVAVRSSALGEDGEDATFAGQQESFLWVRGTRARLRRGARLLGEPLHAPRDRLSRRPAAGGEEPAMGVTVQVMVDAEVSGVLFTCNPVSGDPSMVAINASWGLGLAVVGGEMTPDDYLVSKVTGEVVRRTVNAKDVEYVPDAAGRGTVRVEVPAERRERAVPRRGAARGARRRRPPHRAPLRRPPGRRVGDRARRRAARRARRPPGAARDGRAERAPKLSRRRRCRS